jgi:hypothetical protein
MNLGQMIDTAIAQVIPLTSTDQLVNANREFVKSMINKAYHTVERRALWKFSQKEATINAVASTRVCANLPADLAIPLMVYSPKLECELQYHDERQKFWGVDSVPGTVQAYGLWQGDLRWYPLPKAAESFTLRYYATWADLSADSDVPIFPATWHDILTDYAAGHLARRLPPTGDRFLPHSKAQPWLDDFNIKLEQMLASDLVMDTWDKVPNYGFEDNVLALGDW